MSELLEEISEKLKTAERFNERTKKFDDTELDQILAIRNEAKLEVWQEVTKLVEKHEKPKGLLQYVRPPYSGLPLEFSTNFWALKYRVLDYVQLGADVKEARTGIEEEFSKFHFAELDIELTEEQQKVYEELVSAYKTVTLDSPDSNDNLVAAIWEINGHGDKNAIPALRKFLSEVE